MEVLALCTRVPKLVWNQFRGHRCALPKTQLLAYVGALFANMTCKGGMAPLTVPLMGSSALLGDAVAQSHHISLKSISERCVHIQDGFALQAYKSCEGGASYRAAGISVQAESAIGMKT